MGNKLYEVKFCIIELLKWLDSPNSFLAEKELFN